MPHRARRSLAAAFLCLAIALPVVAAGIPPGDGRIVVDIDGIALEVYTYKPAGYRDGALVLVFHGVSRNADGYRDYAKPLADKRGLLIAAPRFDRERFPDWRYASGGMSRQAKKADSGELALEPAANWTGNLILKLVDSLRAVEQRAAMPYSMFGHSAGGQLLGRYAGFFASDARRIVIANPSSYLFPSRKLVFPYGYGGLPPRLSEDEVLRRYLAQPITLLLGQWDVAADRNLDIGASAMRQGANRYQRGRAAFRAAQELAAERGWVFNWDLVEVPGVGHSAARMFASAAAAATLDR